jgi:electron transfer flavoprotein beta subunit
MRGIRQVASVPIPTFNASSLGIDPSNVGEAAARVKRVDYFVPALGKGAQMLEGSREENIDKLVELVAAKGGLK